MKIYFPTMENLFSCDGNFSFMQWYQNNVPNRNFLHIGQEGFLFSIVLTEQIAYV